jgi:hypothetical protein
VVNPHINRHGRNWIETRWKGIKSFVGDLNLSDVFRTGCLKLTRSQVCKKVCLWLTWVSNGVLIRKYEHPRRIREKIRDGSVVTGLIVVMQISVFEFLLLRWKKLFKLSFYSKWLPAQKNRDDHVSSWKNRRGVMLSCVQYCAELLPNNNMRECCGKLVHKLLSCWLVQQYAKGLSLTNMSL